MRSDDQGGCTFRFACLEGLGVLGLRGEGPVAAEPVEVAQVDGLSLKHLREGRFVHISDSGRRRTFGLWRLANVPQDGEWHELGRIMHQGLRFLVLAPQPSAERER